MVLNPDIRTHKKHSQKQNEHTHTRIHTYIHTYTHIHTHTSHTHTHHIHTHTYRHTYIHTCTHANSLTLTPTQTLSYTFRMTESSSHTRLISLLRRQYNAMTPTRLVAWNTMHYISESDALHSLIPTASLITSSTTSRPSQFPWEELQERIVSEILEQPMNPAHPPGAEYQLNFIKTMISAMEKNDIVVADAVYERFAKVMKEMEEESRDGCEEKQGCKTYCLSESVFVTLRERKEMISCGTTGLVTWQAGLAMIEWALAEEQSKGSGNAVGAGGMCEGGVKAHHDPNSRTITVSCESRGEEAEGQCGSTLANDSRASIHSDITCDQPSIFRGRRILELGCGVGFLGLAIHALFCPAYLVLSDCHPMVLDMLHTNLAVNNVVAGHSNGTFCCAMPYRRI